MPTYRVEGYSLYKQAKGWFEIITNINYFLLTCVPASPVLGEGDPVIGVGGLHLVLELPLSEDGCIWAGPPLVDPPIQVPLQNSR